MVYPPAKTPFHGFWYPVVIKSIIAGHAGMKLSEDINQPPRFHAMKSLPHLRRETNMAQKSFGVMDIYGLRRYVEIATPD